MREWRVGGALIRHGDGLVLCGNRRRNSSIEWTPPGGVIDHGETVRQGVAREVLEETGLVVESFAQRVYRVVVSAPQMGWTLKVEAWEVAVRPGAIVLADPDGIVEVVRHVDADEAIDLLGSSPPWVAVPVRDWMSGRTRDTYRWILHGPTRNSARVERLE